MSASAATLHLSRALAVLQAVERGGTLTVTGPDPLLQRGNVTFECDGRYVMTLESASGARHARGEGSTIEATLRQLLDEWIDSALEQAPKVST